MTLIKSISGIRGTIGGRTGEALTPPDVVAIVSAYSQWIIKEASKKKCSVVIGRDARTSGPIIEKLVAATLCSMGVDVFNLGMASTPTVEMAVIDMKADGGIIITASHNPANWNALKLLNSKGEFIGEKEGNSIIRNADAGNFIFQEYTGLGNIYDIKDFDDVHISMVMELQLVNSENIKKRNFRIVVDGVNSVGGVIIPKLLRKLGVNEIYELNCSPDGLFAHNPEPVPENLSDICKMVKEKKADLGIVVDPDVDRLSIINEDGTFFGEEYTLVAVADYVLSKTPGNTASNLSSTMALKDIADRYGMKHFAAPVGELNVVEVMKKNQCIIGGEGNGGVIYPELHYGRDALAGVALFLSHLAEKRMRTSELRNTYPHYVMLKEKIILQEGTDIDRILSNVKKHFNGFPINETDGLRIDFDKGWVHIRKSNTEPIIRIYAEGVDSSVSDSYVNIIKKVIS